MGYWMFFFDYDQWYDLYEKNCSLKSQAEWYAVGKPNIYLGYLYLITGILSELTYLPFMIVMLKKEFIQYSAYKFMFMMGIYDILILPCNGIITGIQVILGQHFCNNPKLYFWMGVIGCDGFYGVTVLCLILAFDRFLEMCFPSIAPHVFGGWKTYLWMCVPILYQGYCGFQLSHVFNIKLYAMHHDPFHFIPGMENSPKFNFKSFQTFFACHNCLILLFLVLFYGGLVIITKLRSKMFNQPKISKVQKQITFQAVCVCGEMFFAPLLHVCMLFWEFPVYIEIIAHFSWICLHGDTPIIYFILNKSLRKAVIKYFSPLLKFPNSFLKTASQKALFSISHSNSNRIAPYTTNANGNNDRIFG